MAVLLGLLMVGVTAGSASAGYFLVPLNTQDLKSLRSLSDVNIAKYPLLQSERYIRTYNPIVQPQIFLDEDQVQLYFDKWGSFKYRKTIYLSFWWGIDAGYVPNAGSPDRVSILIPWEVKTNSGWIQMFEYDNPTVYVDVNPEYKDKVKIIKDGDGFPMIEKTIGGISYRLKRIVVSIPENDIHGGTIYVGVTPKAQFDGVTFPVVMSYLHTWSWAAFASVAVGTVISGIAYIVFPELSPLGAIVVNAFTSFTSYEVMGRLPTDKYWIVSRMFNIEVSYNAYPEKQYHPPLPPCVHGICPTNITPGVQNSQ